LRKEEETFSRRQQGGGSLMVWGDFGFGGKLAISSGRMKAVAYQNMFGTHHSRKIYVARVGLCSKKTTLFT